MKLAHWPKISSWWYPETLEHNLTITLIWISIGAATWMVWIVSVSTVPISIAENQKNLLEAVPKQTTGLATKVGDPKILTSQHPPIASGRIVVTGTWVPIVPVGVVPWRWRVVPGIPGTRVISAGVATEITALWNLIAALPPSGWGRRGGQHQQAHCLLPVFRRVAIIPWWQIHISAGREGFSPRGTPIAVSSSGHRSWRGREDMIMEFKSTDCTYNYQDNNRTEHSDKNWVLKVIMSTLPFTNSANHKCQKREKSCRIPVTEAGGWEGGKLSTLVAEKLQW